ncbi:hypothetical protein L7F22_017266 [Adiantum nelumboides]|nr:hypothetical protein [Adiantum nelumboides]
MLWRLGEDERLTTDVAHGGGTSKQMDTTLEEKINRFCMLHHPTMDKWLTTYETAKEERYDAQRAFRARQRGRMVRYLSELEVLPRFMPLLWLHQQLTKAEEEGVHVSLEEWEFSRGCSDKYKSYSAAWSRGRHFRVDHIDKKRVIFDSGVMAKFEQASRRRATDQNIVIAEMQYFGLLKEIINADYRSFTILIFDVQWFKVIFYPKPSDERWWYVIEVAPRGARIYENYNLITVADAEPIETEVAELPDIDMTMPEDDVKPIEIEVAEIPEDDIVDLNDIDFSLGGELTVDLEVFRHTVMQTFAAQRQDLKDYVIDTLYHDFPVPTPGDRFGREYMLLHMREYLKHRRDDARRATQRPDWLDREEWRQIREERVTAPDRWEQQRKAAWARIDAGSSHHLGSGGWDNFDEDFQGTTGRAVSRLERSLGAQHGLTWVIELLDRRGGESPYTEPLTRAELPDPPQLQGLLKEDVVLDTALVDMYAKCGVLQKAQKVLEELLNKARTKKCQKKEKS